MVKLLLMKAPILVPPINGEPLLLYIAATTQVASAALVVEREEEGHTLKVQCPMYFISEVSYAILPPNPETPVRRPYRQEEVASLLRVASGDDCDVLPSR